MIEVLTKAGGYVFMILLGIFLRKVGVFKKSDFYVLSNVVMKITLPAAIIYNFSDVTLDAKLLLLSLIGFLGGVIMISAIYLVDVKKEKEVKAFDVLNVSGYNVGNFTLPFAQSFLGASGVVACSIFDVGNAIICFGGAFSLALMIKGEEEGRSGFLNKLKPIFKSVPFDTYIIMIILSFLKIRLPEFVINLGEAVGGANAFLAMLMIGIGFSLKLNKEMVSSILKIIIIRYGISIVIAYLLYNYAPFGLAYRQAITLLALSPIASAVPAFTGDLKGDIGLSSAVNSISIIISLILITGTLMIII